MAVARFADIIDLADPVKLGQMALDEFPQRSEFSQANIYARDPEYDNLAASAGFTFKMYAWEFRAIQSEPVNDDPNDEIVPQGLTTNSFTAVNHYTALSYGVMDVVRDASMLSDPLQQIASYDGTIWSKEMDRYASAFASTAVTVANTARPGRYLLNVATEDGNLANDANRIGPEATLDALHMSGLGWSSYTIAVMSHRVFLRLQKNNLIDVVEDSNQNVRFNSYLGMRVVLVEDQFLDRAGTTSGTVSRVLLMRPGAIPLGMAKPVSRPGIEFVDNPKAGHGSGKSEFVSRQRFALGIRGVDFTGTIASYPTFTQFTTAANWTFNQTYIDENRDIGLLAMDVNV